MTTWKALYGMIWLCFATLFVAVFDPIPKKGYVHAVLGIAVLVLAFRNRALLARSGCPPRLHRIAAATVKVCLLALVTGAALAVPQLEPHKWVVGAIKAVHILAIGAIVTQTASVATAHDVWHERECDPGPPQG